MSAAIGSLALTDTAAAAPTVLQPMSLCNAEFASLHAAEQALVPVGVKPGRVAIAVASPVGNDQIRLTNPAWSCLLAKGRFAAYLESVTIRVITHSHPGLPGAAVALRAHGNQDRDR
ncbi:MAG: glucokinase [Luteimonas sp.]